MTETIPTEAAAERLAGIIRDYWAKRGWYVTTRLEYVRGSHTSEKRTERMDGHWAIHSDMVNGMPTKRMMEMAA
jgi:hypothetical protein